MKKLRQTGFFLAAWLAGTSLFPGKLPAMETAWLFDGTAGLMVGSNPLNTGQVRENSSGGPVLNWYLSPLMGWHYSNWLFSPSWDFNYTGANLVLKVEDNNFLFVQQVTNSINLGGTYSASEDTKFKSYLFVTEFNGKQVYDEEWGRGLYDFQDLGARFAWSHKWDTSTPFKSELGYQFYQRQYPNYFTLTTGTAQTLEKNSNNNKLSVDLDWIWSSAWRTTLSYSLQTEYFPQNAIIDSTGTTVSGTNRFDYIHTLSVRVPWILEKSQWTLEADYERRMSNLAYLDAQQFVFMPNYESYVDGTLSLTYSRSLGQRWWFFAQPVFNAVGLLEARVYDGRMPKDQNGNYIGANEIDTTSSLSLQFNWRMYENWTGYFNLSNAGYKSNNVNSTTSSTLYNYDFLNIGLGTQWSY